MAKSSLLLRRFGTKTQASAGFTIIELLVVLTLLGIMATWAIPTFREFSANQQVQNTAAQLMTSIQETRTLAVARNRAATISPLENNDWASGWQIFVDTNKNGALDSDEEVINTHGPMGARLSVVAMSNCSLQNSFTYLADGFLAPVGNGGVGIRSSDTRRTRCVVVSVSGRPRICGNDMEGGSAQRCDIAFAP